MNDTDNIAKEAIKLATKWQHRANKVKHPHEEVRHKRLARLFAKPKDKVLLTKLIDQSFRSANNRRVADQIHHLLTYYGIPEFFSPLEKFLMLLFIHVGRFYPKFAVSRMIKKMRQDSNYMIRPAERETLVAFLQKRKRQGIITNINHIGEEVLGEEDARARLDMYLGDLRNPDVEYISVKISTIYSQIQPLAFDHTVAILKERLSELYRKAAQNKFVRQDGTRVQKFVNLDMESYRDLSITSEAFVRTL
ncbi:MAG: aldehyde dehydrogenase, partial [Desulfobacterales bacterium]